MVKQEETSPIETKFKVTPVKKRTKVSPKKPVLSGSKSAATKRAKKVQTQTPENSPAAKMQIAKIRKTPYVRLTILREVESPGKDKTPTKTVTINASPSPKIKSPGIN